MTTTITITGTGTPVPSDTRAGPGVLIEHGGTKLQFDAGRSTLARLMAVGVAPRDLSAIFLTHYHSDHLVDLQDLVLTRWVMDRDRDAGPMPVVAPSGSTARYCERLLSVWDDDLDVRSGHNHRPTDHLIELTAFDVPAEPTPIWAADGVRVIAGQVRHEPVVGAVGFRIETPDGAVAITGDTRVCDEVTALAHDADVLVYEAMRIDHINRRPPQHRYIAEYHADTRLIGAQAAELGVPTLVLTHLIPPPDTAEGIEEYVEDIRSAGYTGELIVASDLETISLG